MSPPRTDAITPTPRQESLYQLVEMGTKTDVAAICGQVNLDLPKSKGGYLGLLPISIALARSRWPIAELLLTSGARLEARDEKGSTPLLYALTRLRSSQEQAVFWLLDHGAKATATSPRMGVGNDQGSASTLHRAVLHGASRKLISRLIKEGAKVDARNTRGETPLHLAIVGREYDLIPVLVALGANVDAKTKEKKDTPLHFVFRQFPYWAELDRAHPSAEPQADFTLAECVKALLDAGADVEARNYLGNTPLSVGQLCGAPAFVLQRLIRAGADARTTVHLKNGPSVPWINSLIAAWSRAKRSDAAELAALFGVVLTKCKPEALDALAKSHGSTPLHVAAELGNLKAIEMLIAHGSSPAVLNRQKRTSVELAKANKHLQAQKMLERAEAPRPGRSARTVKKR